MSDNKVSSKKNLIELVWNSFIVDVFNAADEDEEEQLLPNYDDRRLRAVARMSKANFLMILDLINDDPVFQSTRSQYPVALQLLVTLYRYAELPFIKMSTI